MWRIIGRNRGIFLRQCFYSGFEFNASDVVVIIILRTAFIISHPLFNSLVEGISSIQISNPFRSRGSYLIDITCLESSCRSLLGQGILSCALSICQGDGDLGISRLRQDWNIDFPKLIDHQTTGIHLHLIISMGGFCL